MHRFYDPIPTTIAFCALAAGCATVDPKPDYDRTARHIQAATGQALLYRPGDDGDAAQRVAQLLGGGLTTDEAAEICLLNNPRLQASLWRIGMAQAEVVQAGLLSNPSLALSVRLPEAGGLANLEASLAQNIAELWRIPARERAAQRDLDQTILSIAREASVLAADAKAAYVAASAADRLDEIAQRNVEIVQQLVDASRAREEAGAGTEVDVNLTRSELLDAQVARHRTTLARFEARRKLADLLGLVSDPAELQLVEPLPDPHEWAVTPEHLLAMAAASRLDIQAATSATQSASARVREERASVFRNIELGIGFERGERGAGKDRNLLAQTALASAEAGALTLPPFSPVEDDEPDYILGPTLGLELPIFDQNQAQIARAEFAYRQAVQLLDAIVREVTQETRAVHERARAAWAIARTYRADVLPLREQNLELSREAYRAGRVSLLSVLESQRSLLAARSGYAEALRDSALTLSELERVVGRPIEAILYPEPPDEAIPNPPQKGNTGGGQP